MSSFVSASAQVLAAFAYDQAINNTGAIGETFTDIGASSSYTDPTSLVTLAVSGEIGFQDRNGVGFPDDTANITPFQGVVFGSASPGTENLDFTIGGLTAGESYQVLVYSGDGGAGTGNSPTDVTLGGVTAELNAADTSTSFIPAGSTGANYIEETVTANSLGHITFTATPDAANTGGNYDFIDAVTISTVPEPTTWILLGAGLLGLVRIRRLFDRA